MGRFFLAGIVIALGVTTCMEPTEVHVTVWTDICEKLDVAISTNDRPPSAQKVFPRPAACTPQRRRLGDIVFVPSRAGRRFTLRVRASAEGGDCTLGTRCVSATRNVAFLDHKKLDLDIDLTSDCIGVTCTATQTCERGKCVEVPADCTTDCEEAGVDAGPMKDASATCLAPKAVHNTGVAAFHWTFTNSQNAITEETSGKMSTIVNGNVVGPSNMAFGCGDAITIYGTQPLNAMQSTKGLGASMWVYKPASTSTTLLLKKLSGTGMQGITLFVDYNRVFQVQTCDPNACSYLEFPALPADTWTALDVKISSSGAAILVAYDGVPKVATAGYVNMGGFAAGTFEMGAGDRAVVDELRIYDVP